MSTDAQITLNGQSWYVVTAEGRCGPLDTEQEAIAYANLLRLALAAGNETACTEEECLV